MAKVNPPPDKSASPAAGAPSSPKGSEGLGRIKLHRLQATSTGDESASPALNLYPTDRRSHEPQQLVLVSYVCGLYAIEKAARELDDARRLAMRQSQSKPILEKIKAWLDAESKLVLPRSAMALAMQYTLNQWDALNVYATAGMLNIDNNAAERALKRIAIGRRNWLFAGNDAFGQVGATLSTLIASAQRHGLDPQRYLMSVLAKIGQTPEGEIEQFLPDIWKAEVLAEAERLKAKQVVGLTGAILEVPTSEPASRTD